MKKRILSLVLSLLLLISTVPLTALATTTPAFVVSEAVGHPGETVTITVSTQNNSGICSFALEVAYDANALELVSSAAGEFAGIVFSMDTTYNPYTLNWANTVNPNNTTNGTIATLTFKIKESAPLGKHAITVTYNPDNVFDFDENNVYFDVVNGKITVNCAHIDTTDVPASASTCVTPGNEAYTICNDCGEVIVGSDEPLGLADHVYTNDCDVDCNTENCSVTRTPADHVYDNACDADCNVCGDARTPADHVYDDACDADCNVCSATRTPADHVYDNACDADCNVCGDARTPADHVYYNACDADCNVCGAVRKPSDHVYDNDCDADCNVCGATRTPSDHIYDNDCDADCNECTHGRTPADHVYNNACDADCNVCGAVRKPADHMYDNACDADCNVCGATRTPADHVYDNACDADCNVCGAARTPADHVYDNTCDVDCNVCDDEREITHTWESEWTANGTSHWHECGVCGEKKDMDEHAGGSATCKQKAKCSVCETAYGALAEHDYSEQVADAKYLKAKATCVDKAVYYKNCSMCDLASATETFEYGSVDADNHIGGTEIKKVLDATCDAEGYTGDTHCKSCGEKIADGKSIEKLPHVINEWEISKEATTEATGEKVGTCENCGNNFTVETGKLVSEIKEDKIEGMDSVTIEIVGETNISESVVFYANEVLNTISEKEKGDIQTAIDMLKDEVKNHKIAAVFDMKFILRETTTNGENIRDEEFKLAGKVKVTIPVPADMMEKFDNLKLIHVKDDGSVEVVPFAMNGNFASFEATGFSYYTFTGTEKTVAENGKNPTTGDFFPILWIGMASMSILIGTAVMVEKQKKTRSN